MDGYTGRQCQSSDKVGVRVVDFDMDKKEQAIEQIKASSMDIEGLQGMDIKWIGWRSTPIPGKELASW